MKLCITVEIIHYLFPLFWPIFHKRYSGEIMLFSGLQISPVLPCEYAENLCTFPFMSAQPTHTTERSSIVKNNK